LLFLALKRAKKRLFFDFCLFILASKFDKLTIKCNIKGILEPHAWLQKLDAKIAELELGEVALY